MAKGGFPGGMGGMGGGNMQQLMMKAQKMQQDLAKAQEGSGPGAPFGYDGQGCNVYTRTVYGARTSVTVGVCATLGVAVLGSVLGGLAGSQALAVVPAATTDVAVGETLRVIPLEGLA